MLSINLDHFYYILGQFLHFHFASFHLLQYLTSMISFFPLQINFVSSLYLSLFFSNIFLIQLLKLLSPYFLLLLFSFMKLSLFFFLPNFIKTNTVTIQEFNLSLLYSNTKLFINQSLKVGKCFVLLFKNL